ncbi:unnamed protein product [Amoebophrya sp. A120]|nr:unnamed protein product [Amoebophrya sp. A120]|eukprot:GSA120T00013647001.1
MPVVHEKLPPNLVKSGRLLALMQHRFLHASDLASQVIVFQTQTYLQCILARASLLDGNPGCSKQLPKQVVVASTSCTTSS